MPAGGGAKEVKTTTEALAALVGHLPGAVGTPEMGVGMKALFDRFDRDGSGGLDIVELLMEFESQFGTKIPDEQAEKVHTVGQAIDFIKANRTQG